jgi:hypothetical protein
VIELTWVENTEDISFSKRRSGRQHEACGNQNEPPIESADTNGLRLYELDQTTVTSFVYRTTKHVQILSAEETKSE